MDGWCVSRIVSCSSWLRRLRSNLQGTDMTSPPFKPVARMSEAICGTVGPGYRYAHPGYEQEPVVSKDREVDPSTVRRRRRERALRRALRDALPLPQLVPEHPDHHRSDKHHDRQAHPREIDQRWTGTDADQAPADAEQNRACDQRRVDVAPFGPGEFRGEERRGAAAGQREA